MLEFQIHYKFLQKSGWANELRRIKSYLEYACKRNSLKKPFQFNRLFSYLLDTQMWMAQPIGQVVSFFSRFFCFSSSFICWAVECGWHSPLGRSPNPLSRRHIVQTGNWIFISALKYPHPVEVIYFFWNWSFLDAVMHFINLIHRFWLCFLEFVLIWIPKKIIFNWELFWHFLYPNLKPT